MRGRIRGHADFHEAIAAKLTPQLSATVIVTLNAQDELTVQPLHVMIE